MRPSALTPLLRRRPLPAAAAVAALIALAALVSLLAGPGPAQAHGGAEGHVHFVALGGGCSLCPDAPTGWAEPGPDPGQITVHWTPATTGEDATNWRVYRDAEGTVLQSVNIFDPNARSHTFSGLKPGVAYQIQVAGFNAADGTGDFARADNVVAFSDPPRFLWAEVDGRTLKVNFDEELDAASLPAGSAFTVSVTAPAGAARTIAGTGTAALSSRVFAGRTDPNRAVTVTLAGPVAQGETVKLSYDKPSSDPLRGTDEDEVASFSNGWTDNNTTGIVRFRVWRSRLLHVPARAHGLCRAGPRPRPDYGALDARDHRTARDRNGYSPTQKPQTWRVQGPVHPSPPCGATRFPVWSRASSII